jgi:hypothetical protein
MPQNKEQLAQSLADAQGLVWSELQPDVKERLETTAERYIERHSGAMMDPPQVTEVTPQAPPAPEPAPPAERPVSEVVTEEIPTECGHCKARFTFPVESNIEDFSFDCGNCGARNKWSRR